MICDCTGRLGVGVGWRMLAQRPGDRATVSSCPCSPLLEAWSGGLRETREGGGWSTPGEKMVPQGTRIQVRIWEEPAAVVKQTLCFCLGPCICFLWEWGRSWTWGFRGVPGARSERLGQANSQQVPSLFHFLSAHLDWAVLKGLDPPCHSLCPQGAWQSNLSTTGIW